MRAPYPGLRDGVELGVQRGEFAEALLQQWTSAQSYTLVDVWQQQSDDYDDVANVNQSVQDVYYSETLQRMAAFQDALEKRAA